MSLGEHSGNYNGKADTVYQTPQQQAQQSLEELLRQISSPTDFTDSLNSIYGPQQQALAGAQHRAQQNASQGDSQLAAMYAALGKQTAGQSKDINSRYGTAINATGKDYAQGMSSVGSTYDKGQSDVLAMMERLGLNRAAPELLAKSEGDQSLVQSLLATQNQSAKNLLRENNQSSQNYNTAQVGIIGSAGNQARAGLQRQLGDTMSQLEQQGLGIQSQRAQTLLSMQNQDMQQKQQMESDLLRTIQQSASASTANTLDPLQQFTLQQKQTEALGPLGGAYQMAAQAFGPDKASQAVNLVIQSMQQGGYVNSPEFLRNVLTANAENSQRDPSLALPQDQLQSLAMLMYQKMGLGSALSGGKSYQDIINGG